MDAVFGAVKQNLDSMLGVPFVSSAVTLGLAFYAYKAAPELPSFVEELFLNVFFQVFVGFMVLFMTTGNVMLSLVVSVVFIYGVGMLSGLKEGLTFDGVKLPDFLSGITSGLPDFRSGPPGPLSFVDKVSGAISRKVIINHAKNIPLTDDEIKKFNNNMDDNLLEDTLKWIPENIDLFTATDHYNVVDYNVSQLLCVALLDTMKKGVIFGDDLKNKGNLTDKDINDAKKIRLSRLFKNRYGKDDDNSEMDFTCGSDGDIKCNFFGTLYDAIKHFTKSSPHLQQNYLDDLAGISNSNSLPWCEWYKYDTMIS